MHTSVPPDSEPRRTVGLTASYTQRNPSTGSGAPVDPTPRSAERSATSFGTNPSLRHCRRKGALVPKYVMPSSSLIRHSEPRSGYARLPSYITTVEPESSPETSRFHIIQPVVENQKNTSSGPRPSSSAMDFVCSSVMPPCPWTIGFGSPVVPDENRR